MRGSCLGNNLRVYSRRIVTTRNFLLNLRSLLYTYDNSLKVESYQVFLYLICHSYSPFSHYLPHLFYLVSIKSFIAVQHEKNMILHKSILIIHLIELCGKISDIYVEP